MKLQEIKDGLEKLGIPAEIKDFSRKEEDRDELWKNIEGNLMELKKWHQKKDIVMVAITAASISRDADGIMNAEKSEKGTVSHHGRIGEIEEEHEMKQIKKVIFCVGVAHPLYEKPVMAEVETNCGYDGRQVYGWALEKVFWPENPKGLLCFKKGKFVGYKTSEARYSDHHGYCRIVEE